VKLSDDEIRVDQAARDECLARPVSLEPSVDDEAHVLATGSAN
jgi:hypothetical protein